MTSSVCSCGTDGSTNRLKQPRRSEETLVFELSKTFSNNSISLLSKISEEDLKFTNGILDDYLYETPIAETGEVTYRNLNFIVTRRLGLL